MNFSKKFVEYVEAKAVFGAYKNKSSYIIFPREVLEGSELIYKMLAEEKILEKVKLFSDIEQHKCFTMKRALREKKIFLSETIMDDDISPVITSKDEIKSFLVAKRYENLIAITDMWPAVDLDIDLTEPAKSEANDMVRAAIANAMMAFPLADAVALEVQNAENVNSIIEAIGGGEIYSIADIIGVKDVLLDEAINEFEV